MDKLMPRTPTPPAVRPHERYRQALLERIEALTPESLLDVGCGDGNLLRSVKEGGCGRCVGIEVADDRVREMQEAGLDCRRGRAESLDFDDRSLDVVTIAFTAHHLENLERGLLEAARVARRAVIVLDPWYDLSIPSQQAAHALDQWMKKVDRRAGMVHAPSVTAGQLAAPFAAVGGFSLDFHYLLHLRALDVEDVAASARKAMEPIGAPADLAAELAGILDDARLTGISDDGAILLIARRA